MAWWDGMEEAAIVSMEQTPTSHLVLDGHEIEVMRCDTDGALVTKSPDCFLKHKGHKFKQPVCLTRNEIENLIQGFIPSPARPEKAAT